MGEVITLIEREKVTRLNDLHDRATRAGNEFMACAIEAGEVLVSIKATLAHGEWGDWLERNFHGSQSTANDYMKLARHRPQIEERTSNSGSAQNLSIARALALVEMPREPRPLSSREMGDVFSALASSDERPSLTVVTTTDAATWDSSQERKHNRAGALLAESEDFRDQASRFTNPRTVARAYRDAAIRATRAAAVLDELAMSFER